MQYVVGCSPDLGITQVSVRLLKAGLSLRPTLYAGSTSAFAALSAAQ